MKVLRNIWAAVVWLGAALPLILIAWLVIETMVTLNWGPNRGPNCN